MKFYAVTELSLVPNDISVEEIFSTNDLTEAEYFLTEYARSVAASCSGNLRTGVRSWDIVVNGAVRYCYHIGVKN